MPRNRDLVLSGLAGFGGLWGTYGFLARSNTGPISVATGSFTFAFTALAAGPLLGAGAMLFVRERGH